ncbi:TRAP transporter small permease [Roseibium porphyridii]|uniref:TRAP transporter small permease protein n=1 Tax=Roseibium porphyridii TaxID=2866279 RepID=A0ABY8FB85_9HYPH|nr:TRAP transporter small permease [Roseibium sp. KMA01]WFE89883.1 TRAP transporter small permease [Roseibium sp. KMA01]
MAEPATVSIILRRLDLANRWIGSVLVAAFSTIVVYVVFSRYLLDSTPRWAEELPRLLLVWLTFIGSVSAFVRGSHFRAGLADLVFGDSGLRKLIRVLAVWATSIFLIVLGLNGATLTQLTWSHSTTALSLPVGIFYLSLPVCSALSLLVLALGGWRK